MQNKLKRAGMIFGIFVALFIIIFVFYRSIDLIRGPVLELNEPKNGSVYLSPVIDVRGAVKNVTDVSLNGRQILINKNGFFNEKYILSEGLNKISIVINDRFDRKVENIFDVIFKPQIYADEKNADSPRDGI
ncbi:MAG: XRE family transcriptional regulator [Parcubacteria group bacterium Athens0714_16]|nr:MAG: XRE family transcriptional regulator [Parcubacteria group bacterium Athens0714_16]